jgi:outer membrane receptor protein involved in Fe transport
MFVLGLLFVAQDVRAEQPAVELEGNQEQLDPATELSMVEELEVERLVIEALKSETTVQEAPAIITVITESDLSQMGYRSVGEAVGDIPSFLTYGVFYGVGTTFINRGVNMGALVLHNTVDIYDTAGGGFRLGQPIPIETIKRVELISGPGGVIWGANSFVGVINMVSKTADDLEGIQASAGYGSGKGRPGDFRGYVMGGKKLWGDRIKLFGHVSYETWHHAELYHPNNVILRPTTPQPLGPAVTAGPTINDSRRSHLVIVDGNIQAGPLALYWHVPYAEQNRFGSWGGNVTHEHLDEDALDCTDPNNKSICLNRVDPERISRASQWKMYDQHVMLRYRNRFWEDRFRMEARAFYTKFNVVMERYVSLPPSSLLKDGVVVNQDYSGQRVAGTSDIQLRLSSDHRLMLGGELVYDWAPLSKANFLTNWPTIDRTPIVCPPDEPGKRCPAIISFDSSRLTGGLFLNWQGRLHKTLLLDAGARVQGSQGKRALDPVYLFSGGAVWTFLPRWNLKLNYAEGYRPPPFTRTDGNGEGISWSGNPNLDVERSRAIQGEINTSLLRGRGAIRTLNIRADYAYSWVSDLINNLNGGFVNLSDRGIQSVEFLSDMRMKHGHWFSVGYTFLHQADSVVGRIRSIPNQWISTRALLNLFNRQLFVSSSLLVISSLEDYNRAYPLNSAPVFLGHMQDGEPVLTDTHTGRASDMTVDRVRPLPLWNVGLRFLLPDQGWRFDLDAYNLLDATGFFPEGWMDQTAFLETVPNPRPGFALFFKGQYTY